MEKNNLTNHQFSVVNILIGIIDVREIQINRNRREIDIEWLIGLTATNSIRAGEGQVAVSCCKARRGAGYLHVAPGAGRGFFLCIVMIRLKGRK